MIWIKKKKNDERNRNNKGNCLKKHMTITETDRNLPIYLFTLQHNTISNILLLSYVAVSIANYTCLYSCHNVACLTFFACAFVVQEKKTKNAWQSKHMAVNY